MLKKVYHIPSYGYKITIISILFVLLIILSTSLQAVTLSSELESALQSSHPDQEIPVIITFADKVNISLYTDKDKNLRRSKIIQALRNKADLSQKSLKALFEKRKINRNIPLWLINGLAVTASPKLIHELANRPEVEHIKLDHIFNLPETITNFESVTGWNLKAIGVLELWELGYTGQGMVVANMDTGVDINHPDLKDKWRGGKYSWFDPYGKYSFPFDKDGHGTQSMGIIVGGNCGGINIGVAPDAKWIAVKIFNDEGEAYESAIHLGFQWLLDPDSNPQTHDAPDVINNSWGIGSNSGEYISTFQEDIKALKTAGIAVVFSAGNEGPHPYSTVSPADYPESLSVGAIDESFTVAEFSSRGPSAYDESIFPELVAPGVNIITSDTTFGGTFLNSYISVSGTSFSSAHITGAMVLLLNAFPCLPVSELELALKLSAIDLGRPGADNDYGYGLVNSLGAYHILLDSAYEADDKDNDGFAFCQDCDDEDPNVYPSAMEIENDGIDQDCNGYDLTINITKISYSLERDRLYVEATSALKEKARLTLIGYGPMKWNRWKSNWGIILRHASKYTGSKPVTITVAGIEGSQTAPVSSTPSPWFIRRAKSIK